MLFRDLLYSSLYCGRKQLKNTISCGIIIYPVFDVKKILRTRKF